MKPINVMYCLIKVKKTNTKAYVNVIIRLKNTVPYRYRVFKKVQYMVIENVESVLQTVQAAMLYLIV